MRIFLLSFITVLFFSCTNFIKQEKQENSVPVKDSLKQNDTDPYIISKATLGRLKIGCLFKDVKEIYKDCDFVKEDTHKYGLDGGGYGYCVRKNKEDLFFFWTWDNQDTVRGFYIISPKFHTRSGINTGMTSGNIKKNYPYCSIYRNDELPNIETLDLKSEGVLLIFITNEKNRVGQDYGDLENGVIAIYAQEMRKDAHIDYIALKCPVTNK